MGILSVFIDEQPENAPSAIVSKPGFSVKLCRLVQSLKAFEPMVRRLVGNEIVVRDEPWKALLPILEIALPQLTDESLGQLLKALSPILDTFATDRFKNVREEQPLNASPPMSLTLLPSVNVVNALQL